MISQKLFISLDSIRNIFMLAYSKYGSVLTIYGSDIKSFLIAKSIIVFIFRVIYIIYNMLNSTFYYNNVIKGYL